ncbi:MAG TPA: AIR synthase related protein [Bacillota bacterium]|nr:AIR synthase related protein [Bacillota bacterium]
MSDAYLSRGVSSTKDEVKAAVSSQDQGLYPGSFCKIIADPAGNKDWCAAIHADGAGTKSAAAYMMYRETGNPEWFSGIAQDSLVMNTDDLLAIGSTGPFYLSNTIGRNAHRIPGEVLNSIISGYDTVIAKMRESGIEIIMTGGETADVGDLVQTVICDSTVVTRMLRKKVISAANIIPGLDIVGLSSTGQTTYEDAENSGISSNGLTAARHILLHHDYVKKYPETFSETIAENKIYVGPYYLEDTLSGSSMSVGEAILSPTRTYLPPVAEMLVSHYEDILGIIHCTGGGQVKCIDFSSGIRYVKDQLFAVPALFQAILNTGEVAEKEAYQIFNMGHRLEIYCRPEISAKLISIADNYNLKAQVIGHTEACNPAHNEVQIKEFHWHKHLGY